MKLSFRWYGEEDKVTLENIRQIPGMHSIVTAVYDVPVGEVWSRESIAKLKKQTLLLLYFIYFLALFYLLFLKNIGTQGLSLNPLSFARELYWGSHFVPIMNLLMFIPLGLLFSSRLSNLLLCLLTLFSVESIQYFGHLGVFDLGDITLNMLGILVGTAIHQLPQFQTVIKKILS